MRTGWSALASTLLLTSVLTACASGDETSISSPESVAPGVFAEPGPYAVGVEAMRLPTAAGDEEPVVVWYPAHGSAGEAPRGDASARVDAGPFPLLVFAHGMGSPADAHEPLLAHVVSWGFVVVGPERIKDIDLVDLGGAVRRVACGPDSPLAGLLEEDGPLLVGGHSAGTTPASIAVNHEDVTGALLLGGGGATSALSATATPVLFLSGGRDGATPTWVDPNFEVTGGPKQLVVIEDAGHLTFQSVCLAEDPGIMLWPESCAAPDVGDEALQPLIGHAMVGFLRWRVGLDGDPDALSEEALAALGAKVTVAGSFADP